MRDRETATKCVAYIIEVRNDEAEKKFGPEVEYVERILADARADGYRAGVEAAAAFVEDMRYHDSPSGLADTLRALAPAKEAP